MDGAFVLPGTNIRLDLDVIVGLVPVAGDVFCGGFVSIGICPLIIATGQ